MLDFRGISVHYGHQDVLAVATSVLEITREGIRHFPGGYDYYEEKKEEGKSEELATEGHRASGGESRLSSRVVRVAASAVRYGARFRAR